MTLISFIRYSFAQLQLTTENIEVALYELSYNLAFFCTPPGLFYSAVPDCHIIVCWL